MVRRRTETSPARTVLYRRRAPAPLAQQIAAVASVVRRPKVEWISPSRRVVGVRDPPYLCEKWPSGADRQER